jgi:hypothetical protein
MPPEDDTASPDRAKAPIVRRLDKAVGDTVETARQMYRGAASTPAKFVKSSQKAALKKFGEIQSSFGEDYGRIFAGNPLVLDALSRAPLLLENRELLSTAFNLPWMTSLLWSAAAGSVTAFQRPIGHALGGLFHYGPGHVPRWADINQFMDSVSGSGHRLKYGHSLEVVPEIVERFGYEGIPAYICHLAQDFTSVAGLPILPNAWTMKQNLVIAGIGPKTATSLVSLSASNVLAGLTIAAAVWKMWETWEKDNRKRKLLRTAELAAQNQDYGGAIESYRQALELERAPGTLAALGQVYLRRAATRPYAHRAFADVVQMLGAEPEKAIPYHGAQISLRGVAGLQALATADVIGDRYPQFWQEQVEDLVNATIHSFSSAAARLERESERRISSRVARPPLFSAAINHYLAAQTACQFPLLGDRQRLVTAHIAAALGTLGRLARQDEPNLRDSANQLREMWARTVLPGDEADLMLATA